jgi:hypothetical protein
MRYLTMAMLTVIVLVVAIGSCGCAAEPTPVATFESPLAPTSPVVTATTDAPVPTSIPSAPPDKGVITGRFVDYSSGAPAAQMVIYLGELSPLTVGESESHVITILPALSPSATTDREGNFAFLDLGPGTYALVIWTPGNSWVITDPETQLDILVTVEAGVITDLGEVAISVSD